MRASRLVVVTPAGALLGGCTSAAAGQPATPRDALAISCDELAGPARGATTATLERTFTAAAGETFRVTLCSNPSTGSCWEQPVLSGGAAVEVVDHAVAAPAGALVGSPGSETFTFRARAAGTTEIPLAYGQPWAGGIKQAWAVRLTVVAS